MIDCLWSEDGIPTLNMEDWSFEDEEQSKELLQIINRFTPSGEWFFICNRESLKGDFDPDFRRWESPADYFQSIGRLLDVTPPRKPFGNFGRNTFIIGTLPICKDTLQMIPNLCNAYNAVYFFQTLRDWEDFVAWKKNTIGLESLIRDGFADLVFMNSWDSNFGMKLNPGKYYYREVLDIIREIAPISQERVEPTPKVQSAWLAKWIKVWKR